MTYSLLHTLFLKTPLPKWLLFDAAFFFFGIVALLLFFIIIYLLHYLSGVEKKAHLVRVYSDVISEIILSETEEELEAVLKQAYVQHISRKWFSHPLGKKILLREVVKAHRTVAGKGAQNLVWLYERLGLDKESRQKLSSPGWHHKAAAIQELSEMQQKGALIKIYKFTNSTNNYLRTEAQVAVVRLTGFDGLRFLNVLCRPLTEWQQLCLLRQLSFETSADENKIKHWLNSSNTTVVQLALRLVQHYQCYSLEEPVKNCLSHPSLVVAEEAQRTLRGISGETLDEYRNIGNNGRTVA